MKQFQILIICAGLMLLAGATNGVMDTLQFHYGQSVFPTDPGEKLLGGSRQYWDPKVSWENKYKNYPDDQRPAFPFSKTALVFLTDGWHLFQFLMLTAFQLAVILPLVQLYRFPRWTIFVGLILCKISFGAAFAALYGYILLKQKTS